MCEASSCILFFQELEQIEEHYKQETRDLLSTVKRLQDENRKLASSLAAANERDSAFSEDGKFSSFFLLLPTLWLLAFFLLFASFTITQLLLLRPQNPTSKLNSSTGYSQSWRNSVAKSRN